MQKTPVIGARKEGRGQVVHSCEYPISIILYVQWLTPTVIFVHLDKYCPSVWSALSVGGWPLVRDGATFGSRGATSSFPHQCSKRTDVRGRVSREKIQFFSELPKICDYSPSRSVWDNQWVQKWLVCSVFVLEFIENFSKRQRQLPIPSCASLPPFCRGCGISEERESPVKIFLLFQKREMP